MTLSEKVLAGVSKTNIYGSGITFSANTEKFAFRRQN